MEALQKAQETFEQAQQEVVQGQTDLDLFMQEAPLPVMPVPQVNVSLVKSLEAVTGLIENMWKPEAGPPPDQLIHTIHESRQIIQTSSVIMSQEGGAAMEAETIPRRWRTSKRRTLRAGRLWGGDKGTQSRSGTNTVDTGAEEDVHRGASGCGAGWCPVFAGPTVVSASHAESQRHGTFGVVATCMCAHSQPWQVPEILHLHHVSLHRIVGLLQHAPGESLASLL